MMQRFAALIVILACIAAVIFLVSRPQAGASPHSATATSTQSTSTAADPQPQSIAETIAQMSLREKVEGLLILHTPGTNPAKLAQYVQTYHPAGLIFMEDNIPATRASLRAETAAIQAQTTIPYFIATDEEGCTVKRLASDTFACPTQLGTKPVASTTAAFTAREELLQSVGINLNFGIVADVTADPDSFIYPRVFSGDPETAGARVAAAVEASKGRTLSTLKHFPGHGETPDNSHLIVPIVSISQSAWAAKDKIPFQDGIDAGADIVMFGQLTYSAVDEKPATLSPAWHQILTQQMGFSGLSITDDMIMLQQSNDPTYSDPVKNAIASLQAGSDLLLYVNNHGSKVSDVDISALVDGIVGAVQNGQIPESSIDAKLAKVLAYREKTGAF